MFEHFFQCPHCWEEISMLVDSSVRQQSYVEDCEVCCNPIEINASFEEGDLSEFQAKKLDD
ncbi:MAG: CPXCG motif-containing cysteine-rich protein [Flavobacteriaceae bacterium]|nr:CPXCG motif-containing cysteine-rich protein [Flavobacteriaceae bacterium]MDZ4147894.1 CPXCG motif-containing cysteine-rich protein [Flavobacteriaceae bacterium]